VIDDEVGQQFDPDREDLEFVVLGSHAGPGLGYVGLEVHDRLVALGDERQEVGDLLLGGPDLLGQYGDFGFLGRYLIVQRSDLSVVRASVGGVDGRKRTECHPEGCHDESTEGPGTHGAERRWRPLSEGGTLAISCRGQRA